MPSIFDLVTAKNATDYTDLKRKALGPYLGEALFPSKKQLGLDLSYIKGKGGLPVALKAAEFDASAPVRTRVGVTKVEQDMPFFRERMSVKEKERQQINTFLAAGQTQYADALIKDIYDDASNLVLGANVTAERMRMQLISTGKVAIAAEGSWYDIPYHLAPEQFVEFADTDSWDQTTSTPIQDILQIVTDARLKGNVLARMVMNSVTFGYIAQHESIRKDLNPLGATNIILTDEDVKNYLQKKTKLQLAIYDESYIDEDGVAQKFFPDNVVSFLPNGSLGKTVYGTTPEESDLMNGVATDVEVSITETGVAVTTHKIPHPVNVETIVSMISLPSFEMADKVVIATVV
jgi:Phage major capsid protein E